MIIHYVCWQFPIRQCYLLTLVARVNKWLTTVFFVVTLVNFIYFKVKLPVVNQSEKLPVLINSKAAKHRSGSNSVKTSEKFVHNKFVKSVVFGHRKSTVTDRATYCQCG